MVQPLGIAHKAWGLVVLLVLVMVPVQGSLDDEPELLALGSATLQAKAHLRNVTCGNAQPQCKRKFVVLMDDDAQCRVVCTVKGAGCRVCCVKGYVFVAPDEENILGLCERAPPPPPSPTPFPPPSPPPAPPPPPLAPPPPAMCPMAFSVSDFCGGPFDTITLRDLGNGSCSSNVIIAGNPNPIVGTCTNLIFGRNCPAVAANLILLVTNIANTNAATYFLPRMNQWLTNVGLANVSIISSGLTIAVDNFPTPLPAVAPFTLATFNNLRQVGQLYLGECANYGAQCGVPPQFKVLRSITGLSSIYQIVNNLFPDSAVLVVQNTGFTNLTMLSGLVCGPPQIVLLRNPALTDLAGLDGLATPKGAASLDATGSGPFTTAAALAPIRVWAGCVGNSSTQLGRVSIPVDCGQVLSSLSAICAYNGSIFANCPPGPPPPPPSPPPPPPPPPLLPNCNVSAQSVGLPVCGELNQIITLIDYGNGQCESRVNGIIAGPEACGNPPVNYGGCGIYNGSLTLWYKNNASNTPYTAPNFTALLDQMGFSTVRIMRGSLTVLVDHSPKPIPTTLRPVFLSDLGQVGGVSVFECANCAVNRFIKPASPALLGLPGLAKIRQMSLTNDNFGNITIYGTAFTSMVDFSGMVCAPSSITIRSSGIATLDGLQSTRPVPGGTIVDILESSFTTVASITQLRGFAPCNAINVTPTAFRLGIVTACSVPSEPRVLENWAEYCTCMSNFASPLPQGVVAAVGPTEPVPGGQAAIAPVGQAAFAPGGQVAITPVDQAAIAPARQVATTVVGQAGIPPLGQAALAPAGQAAITPAEQAANAPAGQAVIARVGRAVIAPVGQAVIPPVGQAASAPMGQAVIAPVVQAGIAPVGQEGVAPSGR